MQFDHCYRMRFPWETFFLDELKTNFHILHLRVESHEQQRIVAPRLLHHSINGEYCVKSIYFKTNWIHVNSVITNAVVLYLDWRKFKQHRITYWHLSMHWTAKTETFILVNSVKCHFLLFSGIQEGPPVLDGARITG